MHRLLPVIAVSAIWISGCANAPNWRFARLPVNENEEKPSKGAPASQKGDASLQVKVDGSSLTFHAPQVAAAKTQTFLPRLSKLLEENKPASARQLIHLHPELALDTLRCGLDEKPSAGLQFLAQEYDRWLQIPSADGWSAVYSTASESQRTSYAATRKRLLESIQGGKPNVKHIEAVASQAQGKFPAMLRLDAARTAAIAELVALAPEQSAATLEAACALAAKMDVYQEYQLRLLASDALRRAGKTAEADRAWLDSIQGAANSLNGQARSFDPAFWDTASYLRPVQVAWPDDVARRVAPFSPVPSNFPGVSAADYEAILWGAIGQSLLDRGDHEQAILALKRAETSTSNAATANWIRLSEANALARVGQVSAATAMLASCVNDKNASISSAACVCLGTIKCHSGDAETGYRLMKKGLEPRNLEGWIGLADAEADMGLACLLRGDEKTGIEWLHSAQARYQSQGESVRMMQSLSNEREYWKVRKESSRVAELDSRIADIR